MKLFVTVGVERISFNRLLKIVDQYVFSGLFPNDTFIQIGHSSYHPQYCSYCRFLDYCDMEKRIAGSDIILSHAGMGTVILCLKHGKIPILFPRKVCYREHVDDHQLLFARIMSKEGLALAAFSSDELLKIYSNYEKLSQSLDTLYSLGKKKDLPIYLEKILMDFSGHRGGNNGY